MSLFVASCQHREETGSISFAASHQVFLHIDKIPPNLLFSRLNRSLSLMFNSWIISVAPHRTHSAHVLSSPALEHSKAERGIITSLDVLPGLFLMQLVMLLDFITARALCWLRIHFVSTQSFRSFSASQQLIPSLPLRMDLFLSNAALCMSLPSSPFCLFVKPLWLPLSSNTINSWSVNHSSEICVTFSLPAGALCPILPIISKDIKQHCHIKKVFTVQPSLPRLSLQSVEV